MAVAESISLGAALAARYTLERELAAGLLRAELHVAIGAERFRRESEIAALLPHPYS